MAEGVFGKVMADELQSRRGAYLLATATILALGALAAARVGDVEALAWGALPVFLLLNLSDYYFAFLIVCAVAWHRSLKRRTAPLLLLVAAQVVVLWIRVSVGFALRATALSSLVFFLFVLALLGSELIGNRAWIARRLARFGR